MTIDILLVITLIFLCFSNLKIITINTKPKRNSWIKKKAEKIQMGVWEYEFQKLTIEDMIDKKKEEYNTFLAHIDASSQEIEKEKAKPKSDWGLIKKLTNTKVSAEKDAKKLDEIIAGVLITDENDPLKGKKTGGLQQTLDDLEEKRMSGIELLKIIENVVANKLW